MDTDQQQQQHQQYLQTTANGWIIRETASIMPPRCGFEDGCRRGCPSGKHHYSHQPDQRGHRTDRSSRESLKNGFKETRNLRGNTRSITLTACCVGLVLLNLLALTDSSPMASKSSTGSIGEPHWQPVLLTGTPSTEKEIFGADDQRLHPSKEFSHYSRIAPELRHGRHKRSLTNTREENGLHASHITLRYTLNEANVILDLQLDERLLPNSHFLSYQLPNGTGKHVIRYNRPQDVDLCHYRGKIRGKPDSRAAISTCGDTEGIRGVIIDSDDTYYIESALSPAASRDTVADRASIDLGEHFIYRHADLVSKETTGCGYVGGHINATHDPELYEQHATKAVRMSRAKRATSSKILGPYNANKHSSYVELVIVVDNKMFKTMRENFKTVQLYCKDITNIINALYEPLNIFVGLVGVVVWNEGDEIELSKDGEVTLKNFLHYRKKTLVKDHPNDNAQLFTKEHFEGGVVGKALKGPICTYEFSGGVEMYHSEIIGVQATTVAHEMGHNFGMEHDTADCECPEERCIMSASSSSIAPKHWSRCSIDQLSLAFNHGMNYCLMNKPDSLFDSPVCGNGFVEAGEQCDCGLPDYCDNSCCDPRTCMLLSNASCATGECCDLRTCKPKSGGTVCRPADGECDLPEYCSGEGEYCPVDVFKRDTESCDGGKAFCYRGTCRSQNDQCRLLWGPTGKSSEQCYVKNEDGSRHGNCGYNRVKNEYVKCDEADVHCGMLHCRHLNERLEFGMESVAILSHSFMTYNGSVIPCRTAIVDLGLQKVDPGLTPDGAKCGEGKMCLNQMCMSVEKLRAAGKGAACPENCNGNGVCNSEGHCHCEAKFAPPLCNFPGHGGSIDSGPATDPNGTAGFRRMMYIFFLGVVPACTIFALLVYYMRQGHSFFGKRKPPPNALTTHIKPDSSHSANSTHTMLPSSPNSPDSDMNAALLRPSTTVGGTVAANESDFVANNNMFGKFKGFTLQPLPQSTAGGGPGVHKKTPKVAFVQPVAKCSEDTISSAVPARAAPPVPVPLKALARDNTTYNKPAGNGGPFPHAQVNGCKLANHEHQLDKSAAPALPPLNPGSTGRPIISSPILESSTSRELVVAGATQKTATVPIRPAPSLPPLEAVTNEAGSIGVPSETSSTLSAEVLINPVSKDKKVKESKLNRITSYLKKEEKPPKPEPKQLRVIDRERLRTIAISAPIPIEQNNLELAKSMPRLADPAAMDDEKQPVGQAIGGTAQVQRAKSMRDPDSANGLTKGPGTAALKRPQSMVGTRPTIPPPRPPVPVASGSTEMGAMKIPGVPGYQNPPPPKSIKIVAPHEYDDCWDGTNTGHPSLAADNIYAVIDESPSPPGILSPPAISSGGSSESMGLLGEIVNEIESRNGDSVYIASTLRRGDGSSRKSSSTTAALASPELEDDEPTYVNTSEIIDDDDDFDATEDDDDDELEVDDQASNRNSGQSTTSSGYLRPSAINSTPIARIAPSTNGVPAEKPKAPTATVPSLSSFKSAAPSNDNRTGVLGGSVLSQLKFQGPTAKQDAPKKVNSTTAATTNGGGSSYKPYHSVLTNNARAGSVVTAAKAKIASEKSAASGTAASITTATAKKLPSQATTSVRTRTPSPRGSVANGSLPNGTVPGKPAPSPAGVKPKTAAKPTTTTASNGKLLTAAARPGPGKVSNVASLQQKFEGRK
ncbi:disintegrin and metalloproteinase domain-containing protein 19 [Anopheles nili]|uniref:disintegrin and metalloproteinase domain-containing protein 19 n=1 Tax=Anopheles nili TaxID=185578 RepID=UPI00237C25F1|nr:disintegrin and metalloproteinase domain-containing protein 19 [Anopheles nili]